MQKHSSVGGCTAVASSSIASGCTPSACCRLVTGCVCQLCVAFRSSRFACLILWVQCVALPCWTQTCTLAVDDVHTWGSQTYRRLRTCAPAHAKCVLLVEVVECRMQLTMEQARCSAWGASLQAYCSQRPNNTWLVTTLCHSESKTHPFLRFQGDCDDFSGLQRRLRCHVALSDSRISS